jgi:hypothetical protein
MTDINPKYKAFMEKTTDPVIAAELRYEKMVSDFFDPNVPKIRKSVAMSPLMDDEAMAFCQARSMNFSAWVRLLITKEICRGSTQ